MAIPISRFANIKLLVSEPLLEQYILESLTMPTTLDRPSDLDVIANTVFRCQDASDFLVTNDLSELEPTDEVVFYHPIKGMMLAYPEWGWSYTFGWYTMFSTMTFIEDLKKAERSPNVLAHFLHINSGGGEAWMLDVAYEAMRNCKKPIYAFVEGMCCSAAYYLACTASVIKSFTPNDTIGSVGTVFSHMDMTGLLEQRGLKLVEIYASRSELKNKKYDDAIAGEPEMLIKTVIDPLQNQFEVSVKQARSQIAALPDDHPVLHGETYFASQAIEVGLIDGIVSDLSQAMSEAYALGVQVKENNSLLTQI